MSDIPSSSAFAIVGAGVHGLSTGWHLAMELEAHGKGSGDDVIVLDKTGPGAGASGIACGLVRNFYMSEPLHAIIRHSLDVWMYDPINFGFQQVGYVSCGEANQTADYERVHKSQNAVGYDSDLYLGKEARDFLTRIWPDFKTDGVEVVLHERLSGYSGTRQAIRGLAQKCADHGVRVLSGVEVKGYDVEQGVVKRLHTNKGDIACDAVVLGLGAWMPKHWAMLGKPMKLDVGYADGTVVKEKDMWTFWRLLEGEVTTDFRYLTADDRDPPILKVELMTTPVVEPSSGARLGDYVYFYVKYAAERIGRPGVQGGAMPVPIGPEAVVEPYGHANELYQAEPGFADYFTAALGQLMGRFEGSRPNFRERPNGGIGALTPDNIPIFDWILPNVYMIADSNHGYKMTGVGKLVAKLLVGGNAVAELEPFRFSRFAEGRAFGKSNSRSPWV